ncbi:MAG: hypothetical protein DRI57_03725 [Deltaproteobacteria bacterium]|nr:MAG: hypothetical protein DRI57_03725 [Deltaproteobacteria bacterium]
MIIFFAGYYKIEKKIRRMPLFSVSDKSLNEFSNKLNERSDNHRSECQISALIIVWPPEGYDHY